MKHWAGAVLFLVHTSAWAQDVVGAIQSLREISQDFAAGTINAATGEKARAASSALNVGCHGVGPLNDGHLALSWMFSEAGDVLTISHPARQCTDVHEGFRQAKHYWAELICLTKWVLWESARRYPDLGHIRRLNARADMLRQWIERVFPNQWDSSDQQFVFEWQPALGPLTSFMAESIEWKGQKWKVEEYPRPLEILFQDGKVIIRKSLSVIRLCLERAVETLHAKIQIQDGPETDLSLRLQ